MSGRGNAEAEQESSSLKCARNDPETFARFYRSHASRIVVFFARRVIDGEVAADLTAETFAIAYEKRRQFRGSTVEQELGWLFAIARSQLARYWRRGAVEQRTLDRLGLERIDPGLEDIEYIERMAALTSVRATVASALDRLPADQRSAVEGRIVMGRDYDELARDARVSQQVVRARVSRGLKALHQHLKHLAEEDV